MAKSSTDGYAGKFLRVDLSTGRIGIEGLDAPTLRKWVGGTGIGAKILYDEVPPGTEWYAPENRIIIASGPLGATSIAGSGTYSLVTKGPLTNGVAASQANGYFGAFLRLNGFDGLIIQGTAEQWRWLHIHDGLAELKDAKPYVGLDTWAMQDAITLFLGRSPQTVSVAGIGPAGENLVRFAAVVGDRGHVAGHNGTGAVMGAKRLKLIAIERGSTRVPLASAARLREISRIMVADAKTGPFASAFRWGTSMGYIAHQREGSLPVKNYQTSLFPAAPGFAGRDYRAKWRVRREHCWLCLCHDRHVIEITDGPYKGFVGKEPQYEQWAAMGSLILNTDPAAAMVLANDVDRLGLEVNECGWVLGLAMECYQRAILNRDDLGGLEPRWGDAEVARDLVRMIAYRQGIGDTLAEGAMRAAGLIGRGAEELGVYTLKDNTPRKQDHRAKWADLLNTAVSDSGTVETVAPTVPGEPLVESGPVSEALANGMGWSAMPGRISASGSDDPLDARGTLESLVRAKGRTMFEDCLGTCQFCTRVRLEQLLDAVNAATGWGMAAEEALAAGLRTVNLLRVFNVRHGIGPELDRPSVRYGSTPARGPAAGVSIAPHFEGMLQDYYRQMGWNIRTGAPLPETLARYGLEFAADGEYPPRRTLQSEV